MMKQLVTCLCLLCYIGAYGQEQYAVANIPPALLQNANAVVRDYDQRIEIISLHKIKYNMKYTVTLLSEKAGDYSGLTEWYDKLFNEIDEIDGTLYDRNGKEVKKIKKSDIMDVSPFDRFITFSDDRVKRCGFNYSEYPYTVTFEVKETFKESFFIPGFFPQANRETAVEHAGLEIIYPENLPFRYKLFHLGQKPATADADGGKKIVVTASGIRATVNESMEPADEYDLPCAIYACDTFEYGGTGGRMDTWQSFGKFCYTLNAGRDQLTPAIRTKVHQLTDTCKTAYAKIDVLYTYLQHSTRYVAVELGLGGWQCLEADFVCTNQYGDCKGLANYMGAMLKEAGIPSYGVLIYGGADNKMKMLPDFPFNTFNHYILCVPLGADTAWLDCTSKTAPAGYLESFTSDRDALMLTPSGGVPVHSPAYGLEQNKTIRRAAIHINGHDSVDISLYLSYTGLMQQEEARRVTDRPDREIRDHLNEKFSALGGDVKEYHITQERHGWLPELRMQMHFTGKSKVTHSGKRTFIDPFILPFDYPLPAGPAVRTEPYEIPATYSVADTELITTDDAYTAESVPPEVNVRYPFASYDTRVVFDNDHTITVFRHYTQIKGVYAANTFTCYLALLKTLSTSHKQLVLIKKE